MEESADDALTAVEWQQISSEGISSPIVQWVPYLELKLEHPDLEPGGHENRLFPDAIPYELDDIPRVFYWRPALATSADESATWKLACATTHELMGFDSLPVDGPSLVTEGARGTILVVDGTIAGDATTSYVASYTIPDLSVDSQSDSKIELTVNGTKHSVTVGERCRIRLAEQYVQPTDGNSNPKRITPELVVRYPGRRELHHPARGATYLLFPSFGLRIGEVPNPLPIPTTADELDDATLATKLGVDLSQRPYPERVLWQAFAYTAFDLYTDVTSELTQLETGHIVLRMRNHRVG